MLDAALRTYIDPPLNELAKQVDRTGLTANQVTTIGFFAGMMAIPALAYHLYLPAIVMILVNRLLDGLDGALARRQGTTDFGGYLDIVLDFIFYSAVIFGFVLGHPSQATYGAFLIFSFIGTGSSFLAYSALAARRGITTEIRGLKSIYYLGGLTEGTETIVMLILICLMPDQFWVIASIFGLLCWITTSTRIWVAFQTLKN